MPFSLPETKRDPVGCDVIPLGPLRARLTAARAELILTDPDHFFPSVIEHLRHGSPRAPRPRLTLHAWQPCGGRQGG
jgi:hypothetical protein